MGASEQYCLKWNDFESNITSSFSDIRDDEDFLDVTLVTGGQTIRAHKLVLSACSPLFRSMLKKNTHPQPMIFLHGVRYVDITAILNFMYHGEVNVNQEDLPTFLAAAEELRIRGLSDRNTLEGDSSEGPRKRARHHEHKEKSMNSHSPRAKSLAQNSGTPSTSLKDDGDRKRSLREDEDSNKDLVVTPDITADFQDDSNSQNEQSFSEFGFPFESGGMYPHGRNDDGLEVLPYTISSPSIGPGRVSFQELGGRDDQDPLTRLMVARTAQGWHCPQCTHVTTTKGNLKSHILSGKHKTMDKNFKCQFCHKFYSTRQSLQVHISTNHRQERDQLYKDSLESHRKRRRGAEESGGIDPRAVIKTEVPEDMGILIESSMTLQAEDDIAISVPPSNDFESA